MPIPQKMSLPRKTSASSPAMIIFLRGRSHRRSRSESESWGTYLNNSRVARAPSGNGALVGGKGPFNKTYLHHLPPRRLRHRVFPEWYFKANCRIRGLPAVVICPKTLLLRVIFGFCRSKLFVTLKSLRGFPYNPET